MPRLQSHGKFASVPSDLSEESSPSTDPLNLPWGCPPGFSDRSKKIVELEEPTDFGLQQESSKKSVHSSAQSVVPKKNRSKITPWLMPKVPHSFVGRAPPFPSLKKTVDGHDFLCFFSKVYAFSNHYLAEFRIEGDLFSCSEQYYTWRKSKYFGFDVTADEIMENQHAKVIKQLGHADNLRERQRLGMEPNAREFDHDEWRKAKEEIMLIALRAKFTQNPKLGQMLAETEDALLVEASPTDKYWGIGCAMETEAISKPTQWQGLNRMGILLQTLRQELRWECPRTEERGRDLTELRMKKNSSLRTNNFFF